MSVFNRRNALLGWLVWVVARRKLRRRAATVEEQVVGTTKKGRFGRLAGLVGIVGGAAAALAWRRRSSDSE